MYALDRRRLQPHNAQPQMQMATNSATGMPNTMRTEMTMTAMMALLSAATNAEGSEAQYDGVK